MSFAAQFAGMAGIATILGVFLTIYGIYNNRTLKEESQAAREILSRMEHGQNEGRKEMGEILSRMDQGQNEARKEMGEILSRMELGQNEARKEMAEAIRYLADLIRLEGEKTRQAIRAS